MLIRERMGTPVLMEACVQIPLLTPCRVQRCSAYTSFFDMHMHEATDAHWHHMEQNIGFDSLTDSACRQSHCEAQALIGRHAQWLLNSTERVR